MQINIDNQPGIRLAGRAYKLENGSDAKEVRRKFLEEFKDLDLKDLGSFCGLRQYNALDGTFDYFLGFEISDPDFIKEWSLEIYEIEESLYLEVPVDGEDGIEEGYKYTYEEFFPNKKYFHSLDPDLEFFQYDGKKREIGNVSLYISLMENIHAWEWVLYEKNFSTYHYYYIPIFLYYVSNEKKWWANILWGYFYWN